MIKNEWYVRFEEELKNNEDKWNICIGEDINIVCKPSKDEYYPFTSVEVCQILVFFYNRAKNTVTLNTSEFTLKQLEELKKFEVS